MKIIGKVIKDKAKKCIQVTLCLDENTDDVWNLYNLIGKGDLIKGTCHRKIKQEAGSITKIEKRLITCTLQIKSLMYDTETDTLRINGRNARESKWLGLGIAQSMTVQPPRKLTIWKFNYDSFHEYKLN